LRASEKIEYRFMIPSDEPDAPHIKPDLMSPETHSQLANFIWSICNLLPGPYKRNEYRKVILPLTVLRRFDCLLAPTKARVLEEYEKIQSRPETVVRSLLERITGRPFFNLSRLDFAKLLDDPDQLALNLTIYIKDFSPNVRAIMERFAFDQQIARMAEKNLLYEVIKAFSRVDLSPERVDNLQMGYVFEELIRIGAEQSNEEAGEHFTPREVIKLMVNLLLSPEQDLRRSHVVKTIFDPACGTGGMLSVAERYIRDLNAEANPILYGQDWNDEAWAVCKSDMLIKGEDADNIRLGDSFTQDAFDRDDSGNKITFDYMLANPPFGVEWKQQQRFIESEHKSLGDLGRFGAGLPRINDGSLLFLQHMLSKVRSREDGGSRICIVFNGSPLFTGDAGSGEGEIRQWIIEKRLARSDRRATGPALLQHRHIYLSLDPDKPEGAPSSGQDPARRCAPVLLQNAQEPRQQAQQDRRQGCGRAGSDRRDRAHPWQFPKRRDPQLHN
jgi:type I restriction enzyme M protein